MPAAPPAEVEITVDLVRALLAEQHPDLAHLPLSRAAEGWDNVTYRLGDELAVRLPRRALAAALLQHEQQWLSALAAHCVLPVPVPVRTGRPSPLFAWPWSIVPWFDGVPASDVPVPDRTVWAGDLADVLLSLHRVAPPDAPVSPVGRGGALADRTPGLLARIDTGLLDPVVPDARARAWELWQEAVHAPVWSGPPVWLHADPHPANLLVHGERLAALVDFGDMSTGDPACDLATAWLTFDAAGREVFRQRVDRHGRSGAAPDSAPAEGSTLGTDIPDPGQWRRAAGWALVMSVVMCAADPGSDPVIATIGRHAVRELLG